MKRIITLFAFCFCAFMVMGQTPSLKVAAPNGFVGINQATPTQRLHITDAAASTPGFLINTSDLPTFMKAAAGGSGSAFFYKDNTFFAIGPEASPAGVGVGLEPKSLAVTGASGNVGIGTWSPAGKLDVIGDIYRNGALVHSDRRLKNNITKFNGGLQEVMKMRPVFFTYNGEGNTLKGSTHIGLVAQELQKIVPELVKEYTHIDYAPGSSIESRVEKSRTNYLSIKDNEVKYLLLNAIKDQQTIIEGQEERIARLEELVESLVALEKGDNSTNIGLGFDDAALIGQNTPNPFKESTQIEYNIPAQAKSASLKFFSMNGAILRTENITHTGKGVINLQSNSLPTGTYSYTLEVDGRIVATKKMIKAQ